MELIIIGLFSPKLLAPLKIHAGLSRFLLTYTRVSLIRNRSFFPLIVCTVEYSRDTEHHARDMSRMYVNCRMHTHLARDKESHLCLAPATLSTDASCSPSEVSKV